MTKLSTLEKKLDRIFSKFIRLRDASDVGYCFCCTCDTWMKWTEIQCGHYIRRGHHSLRWHENNSHPQCGKCNGDQDTNGQFEKHREYMFVRYYHKEVGEIHHLKTCTQKFMAFELQEKIDYYTEKVKQLKKEKGL